MNDLGGKDVYTLQIRRHLSQNNKNPHCEACTKGFLHVNSLQVRQFTQTGRLPGVCKFCNNAFLRICRLQIRHLTQPDYHPHICEVCNKSFTHAGNFKKHKLLHSQETQNVAEAGPATCSNEASPSQNVHKPPFVCSLCKKIFVKLASFKKHCQSHADKKSAFVCKKCQKCFSTKALLQAHKHDDDQSFLCTVCDESFTVAANLEKHLLTHQSQKVKSQQVNQKKGDKKEVKGGASKRKVPGEVARYLCSVCNRKFVQFLAFKNHCLMHAPKRPFICKVCCKSFSYAGSLKKHSETHATKMPYSCKACGKGFRMLKTFRKHQVIHRKKPPV